MTRTRIREGDRVRVTDGPNAGLVGEVLTIHRANKDYDQRAFVEFALFDGPLRTTIRMDWLVPLLDVPYRVR